MTKPRIGNILWVLHLIFFIGLICFLYGFFIEPQWIKTTFIELKSPKILSSSARIRLVHISDLHYKGDASYLIKVVGKINKINPDFVCFTGDLVEDKNYLKEALDIFSRIKKPIFGVPGNHDYWASSSVMKSYFQKSGGDWLVNETVELPERDLEIIGIDGFNADFINKIAPVKGKDKKKILLMHYPVIVDGIKNKKFALILVGHSHGGQVRIPFIGPLVPLPWGIGTYHKGLFKTKAGYLYVNPGIGTYIFPVRFFCRPEITVIDLLEMR